MMFGRLRLIAGVVVLTIPLAHASEPVNGRTRAQDRTAEHARTERAPEIVAEPSTDEPTLLRADLAAVFPDREAGVVRSDEGLTALGGATEVIVARAGPDGKITLGCVDTETAARRFFEAPADRLPAARGQEK